MAIQYTSKVDGDLLVVHASGFDESLAQVQEYGLAVINACAQCGLSRLLCIEKELEYRLGTIDTYRAAEFISASAPKIAKAAIVCDPKYLADVRFWEDVVVNRGVKVRVFKDTEPARLWLKQP